MKFLSSTLLATSLILPSFNAAAPMISEAESIAICATPAFPVNISNPSSANESKFRDWFQENLHHLTSNNPGAYKEYPNIAPKDTSITIATAYVNSVTGLNYFRCASALCATLFFCTTQFLEESSNSTEYPEIFPLFYALTGGSLAETLTAGLNYYNSNWLTWKPYLPLMGSLAISIWTYYSETNHMMLPIIYYLCGGLTLSCIYDLMQHAFTIPPKPNPIKMIASATNDCFPNTIQLIATLIEKQQWNNNNNIFLDITDYLHDISRKQYGSRAR